MRQWNLVITGMGSVGRHVACLLEQRQERYLRQYDADVRLVGVARSASALYDPEGISREKWESFCQQKQTGGNTLAGSDLLTDGKANIVVEAGPSNFETGGAGLSYIRQALGAGMHAICVSKGALVVDYPGLANLAKSSGTQLKISGATAAALPTIDLLTYNLAGCEIATVEGVFTGTANYVLTTMMEEGVSSAEAIQRAQQMGIAEPDPSFDLDGWDTACKVTILANAAFGAQLTLQDVSRTSIRDLRSEQMDSWRQEGLSPKLVGRITKSAGGRVDASVTLQLVDVAHPFANVKGTTKAIRVETDVMGELFVSGGKSDPVAAAAAALKDLEHIIRN